MTYPLVASRAMADESPHTVEGPDEAVVEPIPPRYWWLKRIFLALAVLVVVLGVLRLWWGWDADRQLQAEIDRCVAAGEPVYPADFNPSPVPDAENAAQFYQKAAIAFNLTTEQTELIDTMVMDPAAAPEHLPDLSAVIRAQGATWNLLDKARYLEKADWGVRFKSPAINTLLPNLTGQRTLGRFLCVRGAWQHATGDDWEAIDTVWSVLAHADAMHAHPTLIGHIVALQGPALAVRQLEWMTPNISVRPEGPPIVDQERRPAGRQQIEALIAQLLDEESLQEAHVRAIWSERMIHLDLLQVIERGDSTLGQLIWAGPIMGGVTQERVWTFLLMPAWKMDELQSFRYTSQLANAVRSASHSDTHVVPPVDGCSGGTGELLRPFTCMMQPSFTRAILLHYRLLAMQSMAATALAIRLYELDHGQRPSALTELVPDYLPAVPLDPFADDGTRLRYLPEALPPVLYSVGADGIDDGGQYELLPDGTVDSDGLDLIFFLDGDRPRRVPEEVHEYLSPESDDREDQHGDDEGSHPKE